MGYPARTICAVLEDMRESYKTYNFSAIASLIAECQMLANRMEAHLETNQSYEHARDRLREINKELKEAEKKQGKPKKKYRSIR